MTHNQNMNGLPQPETEYYFVRDDRGYYIVPEAMVQQMSNSVMPRIQVFGIPVGFLAIAITLAKDIVLHELPKHILIGYTFGSCVFLIGAFFLAYYLYQRRDNQLKILKKITDSKGKMIQPFLGTQSQQPQIEAKTGQ